MSLRWCIRTAALMLLAVAITIFHTSVSRDPEGVKTRWWDGTTESVETYHENGQLASRTVYGDDGKTVIREEEWNYDGQLMRQLFRLPDGKLDYKEFSYTGLLRLQQLRDPDNSYVIEERLYWSDGSLRHETINTEDGTITIKRREFYSNGKPALELEVNSRAEMIIKEYYESGALEKEQVKFPNTDESSTEYYEDGSVYRKEARSRKEGLKIEVFNRNNSLKLLSQEFPDRGIVITTYEDGEPVLRHTWVPSGGSQHRLSFVEEFSAGKVSRMILLNSDGEITKVSRYRPDGTMETMKEYENGKLTRQVDFDETGKNAIKESSEGQPEEVDPALFKTPTIPGRDEQ